VVSEIGCRNSIESALRRFILLWLLASDLHFKRAVLFQNQTGNDACEA